MSSGGGSQPTLSGPQKQVARAIAGDLIPRLGEGATPFPEDLIAPGLIPEFEGVREAIGRFEPGQFANQQTAAMNRALSGQASTEISPEITQRFFQEAVAAPALRQFDEEIAPRIAAGFAGQGATFSSRRGRATERSLTDLQTQLTGQLAGAVREDEQIRSQLAESAANRQFQAIPLATQTAAAPLAQAGQLTQALQPFQAMNIQQFLGRQQEFMRGLPENEPFRQLGLQFTGQSHVAPGPGRQLHPVAQAGLGGAGLIGGLLTGGLF